MDTHSTEAARAARDVVCKIRKGFSVAAQVLKDKQGRTIGQIRTDPHGRQTIVDAQGQKLGEYYPNTDKTRDPQGRVVGSGNLLLALLNRLQSAR